MFFKLYLFNFIRVIKGYAEKIEEGFAFHITTKKAIIIPYKNILGMRKKIKPIQDYHIIKLNLEINYSNYENNFNAIIISNIFQIINNNVLRILCYNKPYLNINNTINIYENEEKNLFYIKCSFTIIFNILMLLISIIKILMEKFIYAIKSIKN